MPDATVQADSPAPAGYNQNGPLTEILKKRRALEDEGRRKETLGMLSPFAEGLMQGTIQAATEPQEIEAAINTRIARIDALLSHQLNQILHHEKFQKLEASWRGLHYLVRNTQTGPTLKLRVLDVSKEELQKDLDQRKFIRSGLFKKVYSDGYGIFGGEPFTALIGDFQFGRHPQDIELLKSLSNVAAAAHVPFITAPSPDLFDLDDFTQLNGQIDLRKLFEGVRYAGWRSFRESEDARYIGLVVPRMLVRLPYGQETLKVEGFQFEEDVTGKNMEERHGKYLWTNAAYALAARITHACARYGWGVAIRGVRGGGLVEDLPTHTFQTDAGDVAMKCPTEVPLIEATDTALSKLGFIPLVHCKGQDFAAFFETQSCQKAKVYDTEEANANADLSTQLQYIMAVSKIGHYVKTMMRDMTGSFMSRKQVEEYLTRWLKNYTLGTDDASQLMKAKRPLREAKVEVYDVPGKPGHYRAVMFLRPHFQLTGLTVGLRLVTELPQPVR